MSKNENIKQIKVGGIEGKIPKGLMKIFPGETFLFMRNLPGVYVIYFPLFNKVYVGEASNVKKRVIRVTKNFSLFGSLALNSYLKESSCNFYTYSIYQGPLCNKEKRKLLETNLINQVGINSKEFIQRFVVDKTLNKFFRIYSAYT